MEFDFTSIIDRRGKDSLAMDACEKIPCYKPGEGFDFIPMWVADMNFPVLPAIQEAVIERVRHPAFGYFTPRESYYESIIAWQERRNQVQGLLPEHIGYENGVLGGVSSAVCAFSSAGAPVLVHGPVYIGFSHTIADTGRHLVVSPLVRDEQGVWRMDYEDMERKLHEQRIHLAIFCSPHNPTGRVWERWEIEKAMELYRKYDCVVISDEIWSDIIRPGYHHIPTQSVSDDACSRTIALYAPSKTFNLAGLIGSYHIVYDTYLRERMVAQSTVSHYNEMNVLSMHALIGAYSEEGARWVDELCRTIGKNIDYACDFFAENVPGVSFSKPQGTYMLFLDCTQWCQAHDMTADALLQKGWSVGIGWQDGRPFGGDFTIRMNFALPLSRVQEACRRLQKNVFTQ